MGLYDLSGSSSDLSALYWLALKVAGCRFIRPLFLHTGQTDKKSTFYGQNYLKKCGSYPFAAGLGAAFTPQTSVIPAKAGMTGVRAASSFPTTPKTPPPH